MYHLHVRVSVGVSGCVVGFVQALRGKETSTTLLRLEIELEATIGYADRSSRLTFANNLVGID